MRQGQMLRMLPLETPFVDENGKKIYWRIPYRGNGDENTPAGKSSDSEETEKELLHRWQFNRGEDEAWTPQIARRTDHFPGCVDDAGNNCNDSKNLLNTLTKAVKKRKTEFTRRAKADWKILNTNFLFGGKTSEDDKSNKTTPVFYYESGGNVFEVFRDSKLKDEVKDFYDLVTQKWKAGQLLLMGQSAGTMVQCHNANYLFTGMTGDKNPADCQGYTKEEIVPGTAASTCEELRK